MSSLGRGVGGGRGGGGGEEPLRKTLAHRNRVVWITVGL